jgi:hypothetical protein
MHGSHEVGAAGASAYNDMLDLERFFGRKELRDQAAHFNGGDVRLDPHPLGLAAGEKGREVCLEIRSRVGVLQERIHLGVESAVLV